MYLKMAKRALFEADKKLLWKLAYNFGWKGMRSVQKYKSRLKKGEYFPPFLYISIGNSCNLRCQGCWVDVAHPSEKIPLAKMNEMITEAKEMGNSFFGIIGGEPFMHPELFDILESHPDAYFQVFTNGHFITKEKAERMRKLGNVTPLISVEGDEIISNDRRGAKNVYNKTMNGIQNCLDQNILTGVCTSLCKSNIDDLLKEEWIDKLIEMGVFYTWYHTYRPVGPNPNTDLCLDADQQLKIRKFVVEMRVKKPIAIIDAYYDGNGKALCPAVTGISHHISPWGDIEPCPIIQFANESIYDDKPLKESFMNSGLLKDFRETVAQETRGCVVLERPDLLKEIIERNGATDTTARKTAMAELDKMQARTSQYRSEEEIPEKSFVYRLAKKYFYNDFGQYSSSLK